MKIELTDEQVKNVVRNLSINDMYTHLAEDPKSGIILIEKLLFNVYNYEWFVDAFRELLDKVPIQKELF